MTAGVAGIALAVAVAAENVCIPPTRSGLDESVTMKLRLSIEVHSPEGRPSPYVTVRFLDTAPLPAERGRGVILGSTDEKGTFRTVVVHTWPDYFRASRRPDAGTFDIIVAGTQIFHASLECLQVDGDQRTLAVSVVATSDEIVIADDRNCGSCRRTRG